MHLSVGARGSPLSQSQVWEVLKEIRTFHPDIDFTPTWVTTTGDKDKVSSLRALEKTDFFTKEVDSQQLEGRFRISIHSAKDLPDPLTEGLSVIAITKGQDPSDVLVLREGHDIRGKTIIATSSIRRGYEIQTRFPHAEIVDIRGTIEERLQQIESGRVDGVVIAKAALIRLGITPKHEITLTGPVAKYQGQLAIIARSDDREMAALFSSIDCREKVLYFGLEAPRSIEYRYIHYPLIETSLRERQRIPEAVTHIIMTSKTAVRYFQPSPDYTYLSVGQATTKALESFGCTKIYTAKNECQEGLIELIQTLDLPKATFFWPHSSGARPLLSEFCKEQQIPLIAYPLYDTFPKKPQYEIDFDTVDALYFSSPSTVDAFFTFFKKLPDKKIVTQGEITKNYLQKDTYGNARRTSTTSV